MTPSWFDVDRKGLAKLCERRGLAFVLFELVANAWDEEGVKNVQVDFIPEERRLIVGDDAPEGFADLSHAWTLFAQSRKAGNDRQRGRFNLGEKLVLALAESAEIVTTTGGVRFDADGRHRMRESTVVGSVVRLTFRKLTKAQTAEIEDAVRMLVPPAGISTRYALHPGFSLDDAKSRLLTAPQLVTSTSAVLPCEVADEEGVLRRSARTATIRVYEPVGGPDEGWVYEQGIPVVRTGDRYSYDVAGKVPLSLDRDNVPPAFLRKLRAAVLNCTAERLTPSNGSAPWVREAAGAPEVDAGAYQLAMTARFGEKRVMVDPSDREATHRAALADATVVHGNQLSEGERENLRRFRKEGVDPIPPAGQTRFRTERKSAGEPVHPSEWTDSMRGVAAYADLLGMVLLDKRVRVSWSLGNEFNATYGNGHLTLYVGGCSSLGALRSDHDGLEALHRLLLHEFSHEFESSHHGALFAEAGFRLGAKLARVLTDGTVQPARYLSGCE